MEGGDGGRGRTEAIARELERLRAEREELDSRIRLLESQLRRAEEETMGFPAAAAADMISRYSRHLLLPEFGLEGQRKLSQSSILVVGAGGLGSPVALYLAACGVGCLGIVDGNQVELHNLHRQIIHTEAFVGQPKVKSAAAACRAINSSIKVFEHPITLNRGNALDVVQQYDVIVDATDNLPSRYMMSDCCVLMNKPLISGAAVGLEGQSCTDNGILGIRVIGCLQALEAIKVATSIGEPLCGRMLLFDALSSHIGMVKIHGSSPTCKVCGENPAFTMQDFMEFDYDSFAQSTTGKNTTTLSLNLLPENARVSCRDYKRLLDSGKPHLLVDVRPSHHFQIASIAHSINVPLSLLEEKLPLLRDATKEMAETSGKNSGQQHCPVYVMCRRGNDSQVALQILRENGFLYTSDVTGGFESWAKEVDPSFPLY
uniref:Molybdenum cofactor synthesis 3 n=1 Tax=Leersia perrieri TaxID=77586 RepID=A0A0D9VMB5_9ORYZ